MRTTVLLDFEPEPVVRNNGQLVPQRGCSVSAQKCQPNDSVCICLSSTGTGTKITTSLVIGLVENRMYDRQSLVRVEPIVLTSPTRVKDYQVLEIIGHIQYVYACEVFFS